MIRRATLSDLPRIIEMGAQHHAEAGNPGAFDREAAANYVGAFLRNGTGVVFLSERGQIGGLLAPMYCAPSYLMAVELFWFAQDGMGGKLLRAFEEWAAENGADCVVMSSVVQHDGDRVASILARKGYEAREMSFRKGLR